MSKAILSNKTGLDFTIMADTIAVTRRRIQCVLLDEYMTGTPGAAARQRRYAIAMYAGAPHPAVYDTEPQWQSHIDAGLLRDRLVAEEWSLALVAARHMLVPDADFAAIETHLQGVSVALPFGVRPWHTQYDQVARAVQVCMRFFACCCDALGAWLG